MFGKKRFIRDFSMTLAVCGMISSQVFGAIQFDTSTANNGDLILGSYIFPISKSLNDYTTAAISSNAKPGESPTIYQYKKAAKTWVDYLTGNEASVPLPSTVTITHQKDSTGKFVEVKGNLPWSTNLTIEPMAYKKGMYKDGILKIGLITYDVSNADAKAKFEQLESEASTKTNFFSVSGGVVIIESSGSSEGDSLTDEQINQLKGTLQELINSAQRLLDENPEAGLSDIKKNKRKTVEDKKTAAENFLKGEITVDGLLTNLQNLSTAINNFYSNAPAVDKKALKAIIAKADAMVVKVSTDGTDVATDVYWGSQAQVDTFKTSLTNAKAVDGKADATQVQVDTATTDLTDAANALKLGLNANIVDKTALNNSINDAKAAKNGIEVKPDNTTEADVANGTKFVTQTVANALNNAIAAAEAVANNVNATKEEVNNAVTTLTAAIKTFNDNIKTGTKVDVTEADKKALKAIITKADAMVVKVSTDGTDVATNVYWGSQAQVDTFKTSLTNAKAVDGKADATQVQVDTATTDLTDAANALKLGLNANIVDKTALNNAITTAEAAKVNVEVADDASTVAKGVYFVNQATMTTFETAIKDAKAVKDNKTATQEQVNKATTDLTTATTTFNSAKQEGTKVDVPEADKTALNTAITAAEAAKVNVVIADDASTVAKGVYFVNQATMTTFETAIKDAKAVKDNKTATQEQVNKATTDLTTATTTFNSAKQEGTKVDVPEADKTALNTAITTAEAAKVNVEVADDASTVAKGVYFVNQATMTTFNAAIDAAKAVKDKADATQEQVNKATTDLTTATTTFNNAKQVGTKENGGTEKGTYTGNLISVTSNNTSVTDAVYKTVYSEVYVGDTTTLKFNVKKDGVFSTSSNNNEDVKVTKIGDKSVANHATKGSETTVENVAFIEYTYTLQTGEIFDTTKNIEIELKDKTNTNITYIVTFGNFQKK